MRTVFECLYYDSNHGLNTPEQDSRAILQFLVSTQGKKHAKIILGRSTRRDYYHERTLNACKEDCLEYSHILKKNGWNCIEICCANLEEESEIVWKD